MKAMVGLVAVLRTKQALTTLPVRREYVGVIHGRIRRTSSSSATHDGPATRREARDTGTTERATTTAARDTDRRPSCDGDFLDVGESHIFEQSFGSEGGVERTEVTVHRVVRSNSSGFLSLIHLRPIEQSLAVNAAGGDTTSNGGSKDRNPNLDFHHERLRELMYTLGCPIIGTIGRTRKLRNQKCSGVCLSCVSIAIPKQKGEHDDDDRVVSAVDSSSSRRGAATNAQVSEDGRWWIVTRVQPPERFNAICDKEQAAWQRRQDERRASGENSLVEHSRRVSGHRGGLGVALPHYPESQQFFNLPFHVSPAVMIPRRSSEVMCARAKKVVAAALKAAADDDALQRRKAGTSNKEGSGGGSRSSGDHREACAPGEDHGQVVSVLDLGTGSGCLLLASLHGFPANRVRGVGADLSSEALEVARENARRLNMTKQVKFVQCGFQEVSREKLTQPPAEEEKHEENGDGASPEPCPPFRLCICNPPYLVKRHGVAVLDAAVVENEPGMALFVEGADPLIHYRTVLETVYRPYKQQMMMLQREQASASARVASTAAAEELASDTDSVPRPKKPRLAEGIIVPSARTSGGPVSVMSPQGATFLFEAPP